jgi:beta-glucosidase
VAARHSTGTGAANARGLAFYDQLVDALLARGIMPFVTLSLGSPQALQDRGGWGNRDIAGCGSASMRR